MLHVNNHRHDFRIFSHITFVYFFYEWHQKNYWYDRLHPIDNEPLLYRQIACVLVHKFNVESRCQLSKISNYEYITPIKSKMTQKMMRQISFFFSSFVISWAWSGMPLLALLSAAYYFYDYNSLQLEFYFRGLNWGEFPGLFLDPIQFLLVPIHCLDQAPEHDLHVKDQLSF